jgi:hypothetical protein
MRRSMMLLFTLAALLLVVPALAPTTAAAAESGSFYCSGATTMKTCLPCRVDKGQSCRPGSFVAGTNRRIHMSIDNHARGGEKCLLFREHFGAMPPVYFTPNDYGAKYMGTVNGGNKFEVRCERRLPPSEPGDSSIGGYIGFGD